MRAERPTYRQLLAGLWKTLAFRLLVGGMILYAVYHCVTAFTPRMVTDVVVRGEDRTTLVGQATVFRDELVLRVAGDSYLCSYPLENGARVGADATLLQLYTCSLDAQELSRVQATLIALDRQIALAQSSPTEDTLASLAALRTKAREQLIANAQSASDGAPMREVASGAFSLLLSLNRIQALTSTSSGTTEVLAALRNERSRLLTSVGYAARTLTMADVDGDASSGYFYYADRVDGYEDAFSYTELLSMSPEQLQGCLATPRVTYEGGVSAVGKLATSHRWGIAVALDPLVARDMQTGRAYEVRFTDEYEMTLSMTLERVIGSVADGFAYAVFSSTELPDGYAFTRFGGVEITLSVTRGFRLPQTALVQGEQGEGVYILEDGRVSFRAVEPLSRGEGYVLVYEPTAAQRQSEQDNTYHADRYLTISDVVIVQGEDLYDGKYVN